MDEDTQDASWHEQELQERSRRERELLDRAPVLQAQLERSRREVEETGKRIAWAISQIFKSAPF